MYSVVVVDDQPAIVERLVELVGDTGIARVVASDTDSGSALALILSRRPDLVMIDVSMPGRSGVELTKAVIAEWPETRVLAVSAHDDIIYLSNMISAGASGYLLKDDVGTELCQAIQMLMDGNRWISDKVSLNLDRATSCTEQ